MPMASALLAGGTVLHAQQTEGVTLEEVVVTAQKRSEDLQKVPISLQVLGNEKLEQLQVSSFDDYAKFLPSVSFDSYGPGQAQLYFRGISSGGDGHPAGPPHLTQRVRPRPVFVLVTVVLSLVLATMPRGREVVFTRVQTLTVLGALALANLVSLQVNIRRYVTGADQQGISLDSGAEWWWPSFPVGPTGVWVIGVLAYAALLAVLWPQLRRTPSVPV